jgi:hypothetical protein
MPTTTPSIGRAASPPTASGAPPAPRVRLLPVVLLGTAAMAAVILIVSWAELVTGKIMIGFLQLPPVVLPLLFLLVVVNRGLARFLPRAALSTAEITLVFVMMVLAALIASRGVMEDLLPTLSGLNYFGGSNPDWEARYFPHVKPWMVPWNPSGGAAQEPMRGFYEGYFHGEPIPWGLWLGPILAWSVLIGAVFTAFLCMATLLRRQWADSERLSFPLVQLPLEMIRAGDPGGAPAAGGKGQRRPEGARPEFFRDPLLWAGFTVAFALFLVNGLHQSFPTIPEFPTEINLTALLPYPPWNGMAYTVMFVSLAAVGFFFLLPADLLFSFWFFYLLARGQEILSVMLGVNAPGWEHANGRYFVGLQTVGAWLALAGYLLYLARGHLRRVLRIALGAAEPDDREEMMPYRRAFWGLVASCCVIVAWLWAAGMSPWVTVVEMGVYLFVQGLVMSRAMAEGGVLMAEGSFTPLDIVGAFTSPATLGGSNLTVLSFTHAMFTRDLRGMSLTPFLDGQKLAEGTGLRLRTLLGGFLFAGVAAFVIAAVVELWLPYRKGAMVQLYSYTYQANNIQFWRENLPYMHGERQVQADAPFWLALGGAVTAGLASLRVRYFWWPLHPLGYAMCCSWTMVVFWFPMLAAWVLKAGTLRYGGMRFYARVRPFFLGLVFGEFTCATMWTLLAIFFNVPVPTFPWP